MLRSNSKQSGGIHVVKPEERKGKAVVRRICRKGSVIYCHGLCCCCIYACAVVLFFF